MVDAVLLPTFTLSKPSGRYPTADFSDWSRGSSDTASTLLPALPLMLNGCWSNVGLDTTSETARQCNTCRTCIQNPKDMGSTQARGVQVLLPR